MKHETAYQASLATNILAVKHSDVPPFVRKCVHDRSLSTMVSDLNKTVLRGAKDERDEARKALKHLGFI